MNFINAKNITPVKEKTNSPVTKLSSGDCGDNLFQGCTSLTSIDLPNGLISLYPGVFNDCDSLKTVNISKSVVSIGGYSFYSCPRLETINVDKENEDYSSLDGVLYNKDKTTLCYFPHQNKNKEHFIIPETVDEIGNVAFFQLEDPISVVILNGVTTIGRNAFYNCTNLTLYGEEGTVAQEYANKYQLVYKICASKIDLNETSLILNKGQTTTLKATLSPANIDDKTLTYTSSNSTVATVSSTGKVKAIAKGETVITVTTFNDKSAICKVTVEEG